MDCYVFCYKTPRNQRVCDVKEEGDFCECICSALGKACCRQKKFRRKNTDPISQIRLVGGNNDHEGRVEILYNGNWGTVCDDGWDVNDGHVVCRMLGFGLATSAPGLAFFGEGTGDIILDGTSCVGTEAKLSQCGNEGYGTHNCGHNEDAGVICSSKGIVIYYSLLQSLYSVMPP